MIKPTVGRVVWVQRSHNNPSGAPQVGLITYVHDDVTVGVVGFDRHGDKFSFVSLPLFHGEGEAPAVDYCERMPYQKGQAAKTEALQGDIDEVRRMASAGEPLIDLNKPR